MLSVLYVLFSALQQSQHLLQVPLNLKFRHFIDRVQNIKVVVTVYSCPELCAYVEHVFSDWLLRLSDS